jgi:DNA-binding XRE family transcriptional regulator
LFFQIFVNLFISTQTLFVFSNIASIALNRELCYNHHSESAFDYSPPSQHKGETTMMTEHIGKQIAALRKAKGVKQEELASYVGVSAQAVSKWENGGVPDTELLPRIADFFSVSIDSLFDRSITDYSDMKTALAKRSSIFRRKSE